MQTSTTQTPSNATTQQTQANFNRSDKQPPIAIVNRLAIKHPVFRRRAGAVLLAMIGRVNHQTGLCWPSVPTISADSDVDERHVQEDLVWMQNSIVNGLPIIRWTGLTFGRGARQYQVNPFFLNPRGEESGHEGVTDLAGRGDGSSHPRGDGFRHPEQNKGTDKKNNNPRNDGGAGQPVVVVFSPSAETAKETASITPQPPQAAISTKAPIDKPTQAIADTTRHGPTFGICNGETVQAKPLPPKAEPAHPPAFHYSLTRAESATIMVLMAVLPMDLQAIVMAEFTAQLDGGNVRRPVGYVRKLIEVAQAGTFVPSASREALQRAEVEKANAEAERAKVAAERAKQEQSAADAAKLNTVLEGVPQEKLAELRQEFIKGLPKFTKQLFEKTGFDSPGFNAVFRGHLLETLNL